MWRPQYNPATRQWDVLEDGAGCNGQPGLVATFEIGLEADEACRAVNAARGLTEPRRSEWEAQR